MLSSMQGQLCNCHHTRHTGQDTLVVPCIRCGSFSYHKSVFGQDGTSPDIFLPYIDIGTFLLSLFTFLAAFTPFGNPSLCPSGDEDHDSHFQEEVPNKSCPALATGQLHSCVGRFSQFRRFNTPGQWPASLIHHELFYQRSLSPSSNSKLWTASAGSVDLSKNVPVCSAARKRCANFWNDAGWTSSSRQKVIS